MHGIRSTFRDWCAETGVPDAVAEKRLGHQWGNEVTRAYYRSGLLEERRAVLEKWAAELKRAPRKDPPHPRVPPPHPEFGKIIKHRPVTPNLFTPVSAGYLPPRFAVLLAFRISCALDIVTAMA